MERWDNKLLDKKYIYLQDEGDKYWIELDGENYAVRQISRVLVVDIIYHVLRIVWQKEFLRKNVSKR